MDYPTTALPLPPRLRDHLQQQQLYTVRDIRRALTDSSGDSLQLQESDIDQIREVIGEETIPEPRSASDIAASPREHIRTGSRALDALLGGGIPCGAVTEVIGLPGSGKTQLCMQVAINAQQQMTEDGLPWQVLYLDTEGDLHRERMVDMLPRSTQKGWADNIHYSRLWDISQLLATLQHIPSLLDQHPQIKCIILDSITNPFRSFDRDFRLRARILQRCGQTLLSLAATREICILLTNHMTRSPASPETSSLIPALGEGWAHMATQRILLESDSSRWGMNEGWRMARLVKSPWREGGSAEFSIGPSGILDRPFHSPSPPPEIVSGRKRKFSSSEPEPNDM